MYILHTYITKLKLMKLSMALLTQIIMKQIMSSTLFIICIGELGDEMKSVLSLAKYKFKFNQSNSCIANKESAY